jgi:hypothetical protein
MCIYMNIYRSTEITVDRDSKIANLKNKIIWVCCANRLSPPLQYVGKLVYICMYVCICICIYIHICICCANRLSPPLQYVGKLVSVCMYIYTNIYIYVYIYIYICKYTYIYKYIYVYIDVYICMYIVALKYDKNDTYDGKIAKENEHMYLYICILYHIGV